MQAPWVRVYLFPHFPQLRRPEEDRTIDVLLRASGKKLSRVMLVLQEHVKQRASAVDTRQCTVKEPIESTAGGAA